MIYYVPNIFGAPGSCNGVECGGSPVHARTHLTRKDRDLQTRVNLRNDRSPGLIMLSPTVTYREPLFIYAYDRCKHTYRVIIEEDWTGKDGGI